MPRKKKEEIPAPPEEPAAGEMTGESVAPAAPAVPLLAAQPSREECRAAAVAHGGILLNLLTVIGGPVLALILWLNYDRKSEYVSWHALQALVFQGISMLVALVLGAITAFLWIITIPLLRLYVGYCLVPLALGFSLLTAFVTVGSLIYGCAAALTVLEGREFRYRWVAGIIPPLSKP